MREKVLSSNKIGLFLFFTAIFTLSVLAQTPESCFHAAVKDGNGAAIVGAQVLLKNSVGVTIEKTESDERGEFNLRCFNAGDFRLQISKTGMAQHTRNVNLAQRNPNVSEIILDTEQIKASVEVQAETDFVNSISEAACRSR